MRLRLARILRRIASRLDGKVYVELVVPTASTTAPSDGREDELQRAQRVGDQMQLNYALHLALRKHSPSSVDAPGQC